MAMPPEEVVIDLPDGDQLMNAAAVAAFLGIRLSTLEGYEARRAQYSHPLPDPEEDPVGLVVADPVLADDVRTLFKASERRRTWPKVYRRSAIAAWDAQRSRGGQASRTT